MDFLDANDREFYTSDVIEFARSNLKLAKTIEEQMMTVIHSKGTLSFEGYKNYQFDRRRFIRVLVENHFHLDLVHYG